jgi:hypothetical protein
MIAEQIDFLLLDQIDNMEVSDGYDSHNDMKRAWLKAVAERAAILAKQVPVDS